MFLAVLCLETQKCLKFSVATQLFHPAPCLAFGRELLKPGVSVFQTMFQTLTRTTGPPHVPTAIIHTNEQKSSVRGWFKKSTFSYHHT